MQSAENWFQQGEVLVANHAHGSVEFARGLELLHKAADAGWVEAQVALGHVHAQVHMLPGAAEKAAAWYRRAAEQGHPVAQDRLGDLYMLGRGVPQDDARAFDCYRRTAEQAYPVAQCNLAYMIAEGIGAAVDEHAATRWYLRAAAQGDARAYFNLGLRYQQGWGSEANAAQARAWMLNAARLGYPESDRALALIEAGLSPAALKESAELAERISGNFTALQQALGRAPQALESAEEYKEIVERNFASLDVPGFSLEGAGTAAQGSRSKHIPAGAQSVSEHPRIFTVDDFVSRAEGSHLMALSALNFTPAPESTHDRLSHEHTAFTGSAATLDASMCDPVVRNIERRIAGAFRLPPSHVEPLSVLRYQGGDRYAPHVDYFDEARMSFNRKAGDHAGQRTASFLVYLRAPERGGETHYLKLGRKIAGRERMALCHFNCLPDGQPDAMTLHTGEPVAQGEKWLARTTLREKPCY